MEPWVLATLAAAFLQNLRFMLQKHLRATRLSTAGATFARFVWGAPLAALMAAAWIGWQGAPLPGAPARFWVMALTGGIAQILATMCVVALFQMRNFAVGITLKKTEAVQTAALGLVLLGETISGPALGAILLGLLGVVILSDPPVPDPAAGWRGRVFNRAAGLGLASGALFAVSATGYRGAALALGGGDMLLRAMLTLAFVTAAQAVLMAGWLAWRERGEIGRVLRHWRITGLVGIVSALGSLGWFAAFALERAALVKAVGQVELVFTFLASWLVFRERTSPREFAGIGLIVASVLWLLAATH